MKKLKTKTKTPRNGWISVHKKLPAPGSATENKVLVFTGEDESDGWADIRVAYWTGGEWNLQSWTGSTSRVVYFWKPMIEGPGGAR